MKNVRFEWSQNPEIPRELRSKVERSLRDAYSGNQVIMSPPCHPGMVTAKLGPAKAASAEVRGSIVCSCGCEFCDLETSNGGHQITFRMRAKE